MVLDDQLTHLYVILRCVAAIVISYAKSNSSLVLDKLCEPENLVMIWLFEHLCLLRFLTLNPSQVNYLLKCISKR